MNKKQVIITVVVAIVFAAAGFFGGTKYEAAKKPAALATRTGAAGAAGFAGRRGGAGAGGTGGAAGAAGGFTTGQIISADSTSLTVMIPGGGSKIIFYSSGTDIEKPTAVPASSLTTGETVVVTGTANSDGSMTATSIQVRPAAATPPAGAPAAGTSTGTTQAQ